MDGAPRAIRWLKHFKILLAFAAHLLSAIAVFCIVGAGAWSLNLERHFLQGQGLDEVVLYGLHFIELLLFGCDLLATSFLAIMSTWKAIKEIKEQ